MIATLLALALVADQLLHRAKLVDYSITVPVVRDPLKPNEKQLSAPFFLIVKASCLTGAPNQHAVLLRRTYVEPPADGIYEYDLWLQSENVPAATLPGSSEAEDKWLAPPIDKIRGIRIYALDGQTTVKVNFDDKLNLTVQATAPPTNLMRRSLIGMTVEEATATLKTQGYTLQAFMLDTMPAPRSISTIHAQVKGGKIVGTIVATGEGTKAVPEQIPGDTTPKGVEKPR